MLVEPLPREKPERSRRSDPLGLLSATKETFYFGGNLGASLYEEGLLSLHGPDPRPPQLVDDG